MYAMCHPALIVSIFDSAVTGQQLRCDVFVDTIKRIEITTTTRELLLEEAPEMFDVRSFDDESECTILAVCML